jgi:hypothetical protein
MTKLNIKYRPETYWPDSLTPDQLFSRILGKERQEIARYIYSEQGFSGLTSFIAREELSKKEREEWGAIHPNFMGGEYLPALEKGEVEIVHFSLASVTSDQISIRAKQEGEIIKYIVVSEYDDDGTSQYQMPFNESDDPLTLEALINLIDGSHIPGDIHPGGIVESCWWAGYEEEASVEEGIAFIYISSIFYPELETYYELLGQEWSEENRAEEEERDA